MRVPVELHDAFVVPLEERQQAVAHDHLLLLAPDADLDRFARDDLLEKALEQLALRVVVAADQVDLPVQSVHDLSGMRRGDAAEHISHHKNMVLRRDLGVPPADHLLFHLLHVPERPAVERDHIFVAEMKIRNKEYFAH